MQLPTFVDLIKALLVALVLTVIAYLLQPLIDVAQFGLDNLLIGTAAGAFIALLIAPLLSTGGNGETNGDTQKQSIFVGNLAFKATQQQLRELFQSYGTVHSVRIMTDRATRRPRGYGFVEMDDRAAKKAIKDLNGKEFLGRKLRVNEGNERRPREEATGREPQ